MSQSHISYELTLKVSLPDLGGSEVIKSALMNIGIAHNEIIELTDRFHKYLSIYLNSRTKVLSLKRKFKAFKLKRVHVSVKSLYKEDWQTRWKKEFKPFHLTKHFDVVPIAHKQTYKLNKRTPIYLDTSVAFGTGLHATTRFMAEFIDQYSGNFTTFLDIGTGTGLLAILAAKCRASDVSAIDVCKNAINIAKSNAKRNHCPNIRFKVKDLNNFSQRKKFDFVAANLITQDLIEMKRKLKSLVKPQKYLAVSGISLRNYALFRNQFDSSSFRCLKIEKGEGWAAVLYKRKDKL